MAFYDPIEQRICVRIVYDGIAGAGKTTNLKMLSNLFTWQRASELYSPGEADGRTLFFDWVQIKAGAVCGVPLMCQIISVPGQLVLTPRRRHLLSLADTVVFVCESSPGSTERARDALRVLEGVAVERPLPFVVQANKQDRGDAMAGPAVLERLGRADVAVVEAIATEGIGVVDTFVNAMNMVSRELKEENERGTLRLRVARAPSAADVLGRLRREELDPEWAAEMLLEEAQTAFLLATSEATETITGSRRDRQRRGKVSEPPLPTTDVPAGFIWPAHTGRSTLRALTERGELSGPVLEDATGRLLKTCDGHILLTSRSACFDGREEAREALVRAARERTQLGSLLDPSTVLVAQPSDDSRWWVWRIVQRLPTITDVLQASAADVHGVLEAYGVAVVDAIHVGFAHNLMLRLGPSSFARGANALYYLGEVEQRSSNDAWLAAGLDEVAGALTETQIDLSAFLGALEREVHERFTPDEIARTSAAIVACRATETSRGGRVEALFARAFTGA